MRGPSGMIAALLLTLALWVLPERTDGVNITMYQGAAGPGWACDGAPGGYLHTSPSGNSFFWNDGFYARGCNAWHNYFYGFNPYYLAYYPDPDMTPYPSLSKADGRESSSVLLAFRSRGKLVAYPDGQSIILYPAPVLYANGPTCFVRPPVMITPAPSRTGVTLQQPPSFIGVNQARLSARPEAMVSTRPALNPMPARATVGFELHRSGRPGVRTNQAPVNVRPAISLPAYAPVPSVPVEKKR